MPKNIKFRYYVGDFETTVFEGQESTEVWASALVPLWSDEVKIYHSIDSTWEYLVGTHENICVYYHNLKFDGNFWLSYFLTIKKYNQAIYQKSEEIWDIDFEETRLMKNNTFKYSISNFGQWYSITVKVHNKIIEIRDSLKLLPFSVKKIGNSFGTQHKKLDMEYVGHRFSGCEITPDERKYIANDVLVIKEALEIMFDRGHDKLTIGSCCLSEFKKQFNKTDYKAMFPDMYKILLDREKYGSSNAGEYIRKSYHGGWCYVVRGKEKNIHRNGCTADVNSLYPSVMHSDSGNRYPIGKPTFWRGNYIPGAACGDEMYYFVRIKTRFKIKENYLPCIQIKNNWLYNPREWLETSDIKGPTGDYYEYYIGLDGEKHDTSVILTLTMTDFQLIKQHYDLIDFEILDGCYFAAQEGLFDLYINKYKKIKMESKGAERELAKLFLNNLYGKMSSSINSSFKFANVDNGIVRFDQIMQFDRVSGYIPIGTAITSYARFFTISHAQQNYYGPNQRGFIYADTDSIHCDLVPGELVNIDVHDSDFLKWKIENTWDVGWFVRPKTYIESLNNEPIIKCAGMPEYCKNLLKLSMSDLSIDEKLKQLDTDYIEDQEFVKKKRSYKDFDVGLIVPGKLIPKHISGGVVLVRTTFEIS